MSIDTDKPLDAEAGVDVPGGDDADLRALTEQQAAENAELRSAVAELLAERQATIAAQQEQEEDVPQGPTDDLPVIALDDGMVHFFCENISEYGFVWKRKSSVIADGQIHAFDQRTATFKNHFYSTDDEEEVAALRKEAANPRSGERIKEVAAANPVSDLVVVDGARGAGKRLPPTPAPALGARL